MEPILIQLNPLVFSIIIKTMQTEVAVVEAVEEGVVVATKESAKFVKNRVTQHYFVINSNNCRLIQHKLAPIMEIGFLIQEPRITSPTT